MQPFRLEALTVSVNYSDYLRCILENRQHFDRWIIITHENDPATIALCEAEGLEYFCSQRLYEDGATFHKAAALNEGLALLSPGSWRAVLDSDILLPQDFRPRLERLSLRPEYLYGLSGRIICETSAKFARLKPMQPWHGNAERAPFVIGYFQMFHGCQPNRTFPEKAGDASTYDVLFSQMFPSSRHGLLPFIALHAGPICENWQGRTSEPFFGDSGSSPAPVACDVAGEMKHLALLSQRLAVIGYASPELLSKLAAVSNAVHYFDHWGTLSEHPDPLWNESREFYREEFAPGRLPGNVTLERNHEINTDGPMFDAVLLLLEVEYDFLLTALPCWLPRLKPGGMVCGQGYLPSLAPDTVVAVDLLLGGAKSSETGSGFWSIEVKQPVDFLMRRFPHTVTGEHGVAYVCRAEDEVEALVVSLWSLRRFWHGPVAVLQAPPESPSLRMICARLGVDFIPVPEPPRECDVSGAVLAALAWAPWAVTLYLEPAILVTGPLEPMLEACAGSAEQTVVFPISSADNKPSDVCFAAKKEFLQEMTSRGESFSGTHSAGHQLLQSATTAVVESCAVSLPSSGDFTHVTILDLRNCDQLTCIEAWATAADQVLRWLRDP